MKATIEIEGATALRKRLGDGARTLDTELAKGIRESATVLRDEAKRRAPGRILRPSIQSRTAQRGLVAYIGSLAKTAASIEKGRRPGESVSLGRIINWIVRYGVLRGTVSLQTGRMRRMSKKQVRRRGVRSEERRLAIRIVENIRRRGTKPLPFLLPSIPAKRDAVRSLLRASVSRATRKVARG